MNSNRGQYNTSPMYDMKNRRPERKREPEMLEEAAPDTERRYPLLSLLLSFGLPVLFLVCLMVPSTALRCVFLGLAAVSVLAMWLMRAFVRSARNTLTVIYLALAVVIGLALFINRQAPETRSTAAASAMNQASLFSNPDAGSVNAFLNEMNTPSPEAEEEKEAETSEAELRMNSFFTAWKNNSVSEMKEYCLPSWINEQQSAETVLFQMLRRSHPVDQQIENTSGSDSGASQIITVKAIFEESGETVVKRMQVIMKKINDVWYLDPKSLNGVKVDEEAEAAAAASYQMIASTIAPTAEPRDEGETLILYYNLNHGKYYHTTPRCTAVNSSYWPLQGQFPFELINSKEYSKLLPCATCGAPARPAAY